MCPHDPEVVIIGYQLFDLLFSCFSAWMGGVRNSHVKQVWKSGGIAVGTLVKSIDPVQTEILSQMDFDCLWIDLEHSDKSVETFAGLTRAQRLGKSRPSPPWMASIACSSGQAIFPPSQASRVRCDIPRP